MPASRLWAVAGDRAGSSFRSGWIDSGTVVVSLVHSPVLPQFAQT